jgi:hypothetical protein
MQDKKGAGIIEVTDIAVRNRDGDHEDDHDGADRDSSRY